MALYLTHERNELVIQANTIILIDKPEQTDGQTSKLTNPLTLNRQQ